MGNDAELKCGIVWFSVRAWTIYMDQVVHIDGTYRWALVMCTPQHWILKKSIRWVLCQSKKTIVSISQALPSVCTLFVKHSSSLRPQCPSPLLSSTSNSCQIAVPLPLVVGQIWWPCLHSRPSPLRPLPNSPCPLSSPSVRRPNWHSANHLY